MHPTAHLPALAALAALLPGVANAATPLEMAVANAETLLLGFSSVLRAIHYLALAGAAGGALFLITVIRDDTELPERLRPGLTGLAGIAGLVAALGIGPYGAMMTGGSFAGLFSAEAWWIGFTSGRGLGLSILLLGLGLLVLGLSVGHRRLSSVLTFTGALVAIGSLGAETEAAYADPRWLSLLAVLLHSLTACLWIGALWPLAVVLTTQSPARGAELLDRFHGSALVGGALLLISGALLSPIDLADWHALVGSGYGRIWLLKVAVSGLLLALAARLRYRELPLLRSGKDPMAARPRHTIFLQAQVVVLIIVASTLLELAPVTVE